MAIDVGYVSRGPSKLRDAGRLSSLAVLQVLGVRRAPLRHVSLGLVHGPAGQPCVRASNHADAFCARSAAANRPRGTPQPVSKRRSHAVQVRAEGGLEAYIRFWSAAGAWDCRPEAKPAVVFAGVSQSAAGAMVIQTERRKPSERPRLNTNGHLSECQALQVSQDHGVGCLATPSRRLQQHQAGIQLAT